MCPHLDLGVSGLMNNGNTPTNLAVQPRRFYMAGAARFLTAVRQGEWCSGENPYGYAYGNPILYSDPSGNDPLALAALDVGGGDPGTSLLPVNKCVPNRCGQYLAAIIGAVDTYCSSCPNMNVNQLMCQMNAENGCYPKGCTGLDNKSCTPDPKNPGFCSCGQFQISQDVWDSYCGSLGPFIPNVYNSQLNIQCAIMAMCAAGSPWHCDLDKGSSLSWGTVSTVGSPYDNCLKCVKKAGTTAS